jgi:monofunctional biosynthetic peptidoglycan transglycosylase
MVEAVVEAVPGIRWARVDYALAHIDIRGRGPVDEDELVAAVAGSGCSLRAMGDDDHSQADEHAAHDGDDDAPAEEPGHAADPPDEPEELEEPPHETPPYVEEPIDDGVADDAPRPHTGIFEGEPADNSEETWGPPARGINVFGIFAHVALWCFAVSLLWVLAYRILPVPMTFPMLSDALFDDGTRNQWVPLTRISPNLIRAVIASEDNEFCHHYGFDFEEINDAIREARRGGRERGASTISQQTAKNAFLWTDHSWLRKGLEAYFTLMIETLWPKRRIMEVYLNIAEWGDGIYGAEAASRHWFHKPAARLSALEAARLAAILPSGGRWRASGAGPYVVSRAYTIAARANSVDLNGDDRCAHP